MTPKEYLQQIYKLDEEVKSLQNEYEKSDSITLSSSRLKQIMTDSQQVSNPTEDSVFQKFEYGNDLLKKANELIQLKVKISSEIDAVEDRVHRVLLRERYINCESWISISTTLKYDPKYIYELHGKALLTFKDTHPDKEEWIEKEKESAIR